ncbi:MAG: phosphodiester glycosidase family protein [Shimia sp.]
MWRTRLALALGLAAAPAAIHATGYACETIRWEGDRFTICEVRPAEAEVRLYLRRADGTVYGGFQALPDRVALAMNAGMYHEDRRPVGHYVEDGVQAMRVVPGPGPGNFGLVPNGILCLRPGRADVIETRAYMARRPDCTHATQSGPMLVIDGALHPRFLPDSTSRKRRNGVGTSADGRTMWWALSEDAVTFDTFGRLFRDRLGVPNALFLDGSISRMYIRDAGRLDGGPRLGPILAVVDP